MFDVLDARGVLSSIIATGHRMVHGGPDFVGPSRLDPHVRDMLRRLIPLAPLHQASGLEVADAAIAR
ncbi:propionate/acetate kinase, partial [Acinetobacter baumannii]